MSDRELELADVDDVSAHFAAADVPQFPRLLAIALHGFATVERRRRHGAPGAVHQEADAAETLEVLQCGQDVALVEVDGPLCLVRRDLDPRDPRACTRARPVVAAEHPDLPGLGRRSATENLGRPVTNRPYLLGACTFGLFRLPRAGRDAPTGFAVDQQRKPDESVQRRKRGHNLVANVRDSGVDARGLRLNVGSACMHDPPPMCVVAAPRWRHRTIHQLQAQPSCIDAGIAHVRDEVMPALAALDGFIGLSLLVDRESGRCIAASAWETEEAERASAEQIGPVRDRAAKVFGGTATAEPWEIGVLRRDHRSSTGACARVTWIKVPPDQAKRAIDSYRSDVLPALENLEGFCSASFLMNRSGRADSTATVDSREAMERNREQARELRNVRSREMGADVVDVGEFELAIAHLRVPEMA